MRTIEQIMKEEGVGQRHAYTIRRAESAREALRQPVSQSLKDGLLLALLNGGKCNAKDLAKRVQRMGFAEAEHGVVHVVWSLQKEQLVKFYETKKSGITGIVLTPQGYQKARSLSKQNGAVIDATITPKTSPVKEPEVPPAAELNSAETEPKPAPQSLDLPKYPHIDKLIRRQARVEEAAKLLEEAGLIDQAAAALEAIVETDLEKEVIALVRELTEV